MNNIIISIKNLANEKRIDITLLILIIFLPLYLLSRSSVINISTLLIVIIFIIKLKREAHFLFLDNKFFYALIIFWISLLVNLFFTINIYDSFWRAFGFIKFIFLVFAIKYYLSYKNYKYKNFIYQIWFFIFLITSFDLCIEYATGSNLLGFKNNFPGRLSGFLNQELKIGHFYYAFVLISLSYFFYNYNNKILFNILTVTFLTISLLIGERANFIKALMIIFTFYILISKKKISNFLTAILMLTFIITCIFFIPKYKNRFIEQFSNPINHYNGPINAIMNSTYGAHYETAIKIFKNNPYFGVGLRNFRNESGRTIYENAELEFNDRRVSTHPHQIHLEFLSETGIFGYFSFLIFFIFSLVSSIKIYIKNNNLYQLSSILFISATLMPFLPSGSFFTTYGATIFWINYAVMITDNKKMLR
jgi:O-antigen ligase